MKTSDAGLAFIQRWEGTILTAYRDSGGVWTIGTGHTGPEVQRGVTITAERARQLLAADVAEAEGAVAKVKVPLSQQQFDALVSFAFNVGSHAFGGSTLLRDLNAGDYAGVPAQLNRWVHDNGRVVDGLVNRRKAEGDMWRFGTTPIINTHPPEQTSTIPTSPAFPVPPEKPIASGSTVSVGTAPPPVPWYVALIRFIAAILRRK